MLFDIDYMLQNLAIAYHLDNRNRFHPPLLPGRLRVEYLD